MITSLAVFVIGIGYFGNLLKCDQVATYQPQVYTSFEQLAQDPDASVVVYGAPLELIKAHPTGSVYRNIFERSSSPDSNITPR